MIYPSGVDLPVMGKERPLDAEMKDDDTFHKDRKKTQRLCGLCNLCGSQYLIVGFMVYSHLIFALVR